MREKTEERMREIIKNELLTRVGEPTGYRSGFFGNYPVYEFVDLRKVILALVDILGYKIEKVNEGAKLVPKKGEK